MPIKRPKKPFADINCQLSTVYNHYISFLLTPLIIMPSKFILFHLVLTDCRIRPIIYSYILMFACDLWMVYTGPLLDWLVVSPSSATLVNSCGIPFIGFQSASISFIGFLQLLGVVSLGLLLFIFRSFLPYLRPVRVGDHFARPLVDYLISRSYTATTQNRAFSAVGPSIWNGLPFELRSLPRDFSSSFYSLLKTFLFARAWAGSASELPWRGAI